MLKLSKEAQERIGTDLYKKMEATDKKAQIARLERKLKALKK